MPTIIEPQTEQESKPQLVPPPSNEPELFAAEIAMEKQSLNLFPIILILALVGVVGGALFYFIRSANEVLAVPVATTTISDILKAQAPPTVHFNTGKIDPSASGGPEVSYKLLEKAGIIEIAGAPKPKGKAKVVAPTALTVTISRIGDGVLSGTDGIKKTKNADGSTSYTVPLAFRHLVSVDKITMVKPHLAQVTYTWRWAPNSLGQDFDASGSQVQSFSGYERTNLIRSYGADFYSAAPTKAHIVLMENEDGAWKPYTE